MVEKLLEQILGKLDSLDNRMESLEKGQQELKTDVTEIKADVTGLKTDVAELKTDVKELSRKMDTVYEQTAGLSEFRTETIRQLKQHQVDIQLLKKLVAN